MSRFQGKRPADFVPLSVSGVARMSSDEDEFSTRTLLVHFNRSPTDEELRRFHVSLKDASWLNLLSD